MKLSDLILEVKIYARDNPGKVLVFLAIAGAFVLGYILG